MRIYEIWPPIGWNIAISGIVHWLTDIFFLCVPVHQVARSLFYVCHSF